MTNYELQSDEVILYEGSVFCKEYKSRLQITLTSQKFILEKEIGIFKKEKQLVDIIPLEYVKIYNNTAQIRQKSSEVEIQTVTKNLTFAFSGILEARKFTSLIMNAVTGTTTAERGSNIIKNAFNLVDDTLGLDTKETIKGVIENGVMGTLLKGIGKKK